MPFPTLSVLRDGFNRGDENLSASGNWTALVGNINLVSGAVVGVNNGSNMFAWNANRFDANQEAWVTITNKGTADVGDGIGVCLRHALGSANGYWFRTINLSGLDSFSIRKEVSGVFTTLASTSGPEVSVGDKIGASSAGSTLKLYLFQSSVGSWNQTPILTVSNEPTFTGAGYACIYIETATGLNTADDFGAGNSTDVDNTNLDRRAHIATSRGVCW